MPEQSNNPFRFWQELKRRKVIRVIPVYAATAFVLLELVDIIAEPFGLPDWTLKLVIVLLSIGFVISIILSWVYDITPEGVQKTKPIKEAQKEEKPAASYVWKITTYVSVVIIIGLIIINVVGGRKRANDLNELDKSIAVLPFKSLSDDPEKQYLADGMMDAILLHLSKIKDLRVMARTSVEQYRNTDKTATMICQELNVAYLLEGSFQKYGDNAKLIAQLIRPGKEGHVWANEYNRDWKDIFSVQSEVAKTIAGELHADAYNIIAGVNAFYNWNISSAEENLKRSIDLNPNYYNTYKLYAELFFNSGQFSKALEMDKLALALDPFSPIINSTYGVHLHYANQTDSAISHLTNMIRLYPDIGLYHWFLGIIYLNEGEYDRSIKEFKNGLDFLGNSFYFMALLGLAYSKNGELNETQMLLDTFESRSKDEYISHSLKAVLLAELGHKEKALDCLYKAYEEREEFLQLFRYVDMVSFSNLRSDPGFIEIMEKVWVEK